MGALHFAEVWLQVRRLMAETELGLLSLGSEQIGGEHVQFAWPLIVSFLGLEHPGDRLLPAGAILRLQGRSLAHPDASNQPLTAASELLSHLLAIPLACAWCHRRWMDSHKA